MVFVKRAYADQLKVDQAILNVTSVSSSKSLWLYQLSDECVKCPYKRVRKIPYHGYIEEKVPTTANLKWSIYDNNIGPYAFPNSTPYCTVDATNLGQFGVYNLTIDDGCTFKTHKPPINENLAVVWLEVATIIVFVLWRAFRKIHESRNTTTPHSNLEESNIETPPPTESHQPPPQPQQSSRINSLDAFRGLAIVSMIFANSGCGKYHWLEHVPWNGIHPADFIFPSFLWIMGVCVPISMRSQLRRGVPTRLILLNILIRSIKLFLVGVFIHTAHGPSIGDIRVMGVLQRFAIAYFVVASVYALLYRKPNEENPEQQSGFSDMKSLLPQWLVMLTITVIHLLVVFLLPVPNCGTGYFGPGGIHEMGKHDGCIGGASGYIDRLLLSSSHLYQRSRAAGIYDETLAFDPEGPFGSLLSIVHAFFGLQCGEILLQYTEPAHRIKRWLSWSFVTFLLGGSLSRFSINDGVIPINKNLWSLSFVLVTTAFAYLLFTILYIVIDVRKYWTGRPFIYAGMNAILMYIGSELLGRMYPFYWHIDGMNTHLAYFIANIWNAALWNGLAYYLFKRNIFFTL